LFPSATTTQRSSSGRRPTARFSQIARVALRKLIAVDAAEQVQDLAVPPGNRLEPLKGRAAGWHSIRINDQWRIVFRWTAQGPADVSITDHH
jgi:proteic killer suppression protein